MHMTETRLAAILFPRLADSSLAGSSSSKEVYIDNFSFTQTGLAVGVETKVVWTNQDDIQHTDRRFKEGYTQK
jgi:hypothetical protein